jgi:glutathione synthase/RimK-type ligase-like ATP-grasp enzyme
VASVRGVHGPWLVVKPTISAGARDTIRTDDADTAVAHARAVVATGRVAMVQPYLDAVDEEGETSVLVVDGRLTHAVRKVPALTEGGGGDASGLVELTPELRDATTTVLTTAGATDLLYARVDLVRDASGELALMELELAEPSLFLDLAPHAAVALAAGVAARLR